MGVLSMVLPLRETVEKLEFRAKLYSLSLRQTSRMTGSKGKKLAKLSTAFDRAQAI